MIAWILVFWSLGAPANLADSLWTLNAQGEFAAVLQIARQHQLLKTPERDLWLAVAFAYRNLDSLDQAARLYTAILEANPRDPDALLGLALVLSWQDRLDSALQVYHRVLEVQPGNVEALLGLARICGWAERWDCAWRYLNQAQARDSLNPEVWELAGDLALWQDQLPRATRAYRQALRLDSTRQRTWLQLARVLEWQGFYRRALRAYRRVLQLQPGHPEALRGLKTCREHLSWEVQVAWKSTLEDDNGTAGRYHSPLLVLRGPERPWLRWSWKVAWLQNQRDTLANRLLQWIPEVVLWPQGPVTLRAAYAWSPEPRARNWWLGAQGRWGPASMGVSWRHELLEPVREINLQAVKGEGSLRLWRLEFRVLAEWATVPWDTNAYRVWEVGTRLQVVRTPRTRLTLLHDYGTQAYDHWSPYYYSPEALKRHALGLAVFRKTTWGYAYAEGSRSVWEAPETPGVTTLSAELGVHRFYLSLTYFATTQAYHTWTLNAGFRWPLWLGGALL